MIGIADGIPGLREFLARLRRWRVAPRWYALALIPTLAIAGTTLLLSLFLTDLRPTIIGAENRNVVLIGAIGPSLLVGCFEEIGWTGFAVPHMRSRHSILATGLAVGVVWGAWHFPLFWEADSFHATLPFTILMTRLFAWLPPFRVLLIHIHERTRSLPVVMLMHAAVSYVSIAFGPRDLTGGLTLTGPLAAAVVMGLLFVAAGVPSRATTPAVPTLRERKTAPNLTG